MGLGDVGLDVVGEDNRLDVGSSPDFEGEDADPDAAKNPAKGFIRPSLPAGAFSSLGSVEAVVVARALGSRENGSDADSFDK